MTDDRIVAAYMRVSSDAQTLDMQRHAIERCARSRGQPIAQWYSEKQSATKVMRRPALDELRQKAREGLLSHVYVYRIDRFTRTGIRDTLHILEELKLHGVRVVSVADGFDVAGMGPGAEMVLAALAWAAQVEGHAINERIRAARARVQAKGGAWGRPQRMGAEEVAKAIAYREQGHSLRWIAAAMKIPRPTIQRTLCKAGARTGSKTHPGLATLKPRAK
jgi:DNA invertase Pin-like site-specific DNA recombinase